MTTFQIHLVDAATNAVVEWELVEAQDRAEAINQRPSHWPIKATRASSRGPWAC